MGYISRIYVKFSFDIFIYILQGEIENTLMKLTVKLGNVATRTEKQHKGKQGFETEDKIRSEICGPKQIGN